MALENKENKEKAPIVLSEEEKGRLASAIGDVIKEFSQSQSYRGFEEAKNLYKGKFSSLGPERGAALFKEIIEMTAGNREKNQQPSYKSIAMMEMQGIKVPTKTPEDQEKLKAEVAESSQDILNKILGVKEITPEEKTLLNELEISKEMSHQLFKEQGELFADLSKMGIEVSLRTTDDINIQIEKLKEKDFTKGEQAQAQYDKLSGSFIASNLEAKKEEIITKKLSEEAIS